LAYAPFIPKRGRAAGWKGPPLSPLPGLDDPPYSYSQGPWSGMRPRVLYLYAGLRVRDLSRSLRFYRAMGFRIARRGAFHHGGRWVWLRFPGSEGTLELNWYPTGSRFHERSRPGTEFDHLGFWADDPEAWLRRALASGARFAARFDDTIRGQPRRLVFVRDPDGIWLGAVGPRPVPPIPRRGRKAGAAGSKGRARRR
jgi:catechol 2,3-dioxygenase-like lactoylglutathione lyase family enzyme